MPYIVVFLDEGAPMSSGDELDSYPRGDAGERLVGESLMPALGGYLLDEARNKDGRVSSE
jgi:hypothetical protein